MKFGMIGLGRMGRNLSLQAIEKKHTVVAFDIASDRGLNTHGLLLASTLESLVDQLEPRRVVLMYVPHGKPADETVHALSRLLAADDMVVDGGNSHWKDSIRHYHELKKEASLFSTRARAAVSKAHEAAPVSWSAETTKRTPL